MLRLDDVWAGTKEQEAMEVLTTTAEYALRIMVILAEGRDNGTAALTSAEIAKRTRIPADYATKVLQLLGRAQLVNGRRGRGGGFRLNCDPSTTPLLRVVNAIDPMQRIRTCPLDRQSHQTHLCPLHSEIDRTMEQMEKRFESLTIQQVVDGAPGGALCQEDQLVRTTVTVNGQ
jgi:Rrf2 family protein